MFPSESRDPAFQRIRNRLVTPNGPLAYDGDFETSVQRADSERVAPLLFYACESAGWPRGASSEHKRRLRQHYFSSAARNMTLLDALEDVSRAWSVEGIRSLAIKGADLGSRLYPNIALRPMSDVDVLVAPDDASRAQSVLDDHGYHAWCPEMTPGLATRIRHARLFVGGPANRVNLDLHWSLVGHGTDRRAAPMKWFQDQSERQARPGGPEEHAWQRLSATSHLLYLAAHMKLQHYGQEPPLLWLIDFYLLAHRPDVDFQTLFEQADAFGWSHALAETTRDTKASLALDLPSPLERFLQTDHRGASADRGPRRGRARVLNELVTLSWRGRWLLVRALLFPSAEYLRWRYPTHKRSSWPFIHMLRWYHITGAGIRATIGWLNPKRGAKLELPEAGRIE